MEVICLIWLLRGVETYKPFLMPGEAYNSVEYMLPCWDIVLRACSLVDEILLSFICFNLLYLVTDVIMIIPLFYSKFTNKTILHMLMAAPCYSNEIQKEGSII